MVIDFKDVQLSKDLTPISVTELGILIDVKRNYLPLQIKAYSFPSKRATSASNTHRPCFFTVEMKL